MAVDPVAGPVLGAVAAQSVIRAGRKSGEAMGIVDVEEHPLKEILAHIEVHLCKIREFLDPGDGDITWLEVLKDQTAPTYLDKKGHKYQAIFVTTATNVILNVAGLGSYAANLPAGWSFTPFPDKTEIWLATGGATANVLFLATNDQIGLAI